MGRARPRKRQRSRGDDVVAAGEEGVDDGDPALFPVGTEVEVRSDDPGFVASYYEATVEGYQHGGLSSYVVAYSTLSRRDGGDSPLREVFPAANVRPRPPHRPPPRRGFAVHDMVDASHNGGWWAGVVVAVVPAPGPGTAQRPAGRVYKVCFPTSRELLDFEETALRPSREFQDDCWLPAAAAAKAKSGTPLFREGNQVEVSRSTEMFGKYWSPATVLKVIGSSSFLVQYRDVKEDGEPVTEILDSHYIRPTRDMVHMDSKYRFSPSSHAEVLREGSWWPGVISEVMDIESTKKYVVKIKSHEADNDDAECTDLLTVDHTQLRPRYDWYQGKWVRCLLEKPVSKGAQSTSQKRPPSAVLAMASCNDSVTIASLAPCIDNDSISYESGSHRVEKKPVSKGAQSTSQKRPASAVLAIASCNNSVDTASLAPCIENDGISYESGSHLMEKKPVSKGPQSTSQKRPASAVLAMASCNNSVDIASLAPCVDNDSISNESGSNLMEKVNKDVVSEPFCPDSVSNENDPTKHKASTCPEKMVKQQGTLLSFELQSRTKRMKSSYPENVVKQQGTMLSFQSHLTIPSRSSLTGFGNLNYDAKFYLSDQSSSQMVAKPSSPQTGQLQASLFGSFGTLRPLPLPQTPSFVIPSHTIEFGSVVGSSKALVYQEKQSTDGCCDGMAAVNQSTNFGPFTAFKKFSAHEEHGMPKQDHTSAMVRDAADGIQFQSIEKSEITQLASVGMSKPTEARPDDTLVAPKGGMMRYAAEDGQSTENSEITQLTCVGTSNSTEAQPGDTVITPKGSDGTPTSKFVPSRTHSSSDSLPQRSLNVQESIVAERPSEFVKTSSLWAQIEAMEVFRKVPQRPNFHKLQQQVPELREGTALGLMLSFASLAESVKRLRIEDDDAVFHEKMKGVSLLEADGFDVEHLRSRLETLLRIKKGRAELQGAIQDLEQKLCHEETQRRALKMAVLQLELQACLFRRIMQSAISQELSDASEISRLKAEARELEQRFSSATASPW